MWNQQEPAAVGIQSCSDYLTTLLNVDPRLHEEEVLYGRWLLNRHFGDCRRILDIGPGRCWFLRADPSRAFGVEIDCEAARYFHIKEEVELVLGDSYTLPLKDGAVDGLLCHWVLEHLHHPIDAFREYARVLAPGGLIYVVAPSPRQLRGGFWDDPTHVRPFTPKALQKLADSANLTVEFLQYDIPLISRAWFSPLRTPNIFRLLGESGYYRYMDFLAKLPIRNRKMVAMLARKPRF
jgi:SAM-dependent methyltransferase